MLRQTSLKSLNLNQGGGVGTQLTDQNTHHEGLFLYISSQMNYISTIEDLRTSENSNRKQNCEWKKLLIKFFSSHYYTFLYTRVGRQATTTTRQHWPSDDNNSSIDELLSSLAYPPSIYCMFHKAFPWFLKSIINSIMYINIYLLFSFFS